MISEEKIKAYIKTKKELYIDNAPIILKKIPTGLTNLTYLLNIKDKKYIIKLYLTKNKFYNNDGVLEYYALKELEGLNVSPKSILYDNSKKDIECDIFVCEFVNGKPLESFNNLIITNLAKALAKIHNHKIKEKSNFTVEKENLLGTIDYLFNEYKKRSDKVAKYVTAFEKIIVYLKSKQILDINYSETLIHKDLIAGNILVTEDNQINIIDWDSVKIGDPAFDVFAITNKQFNLWDMKEYMSLEQKNLFYKIYLENRKDPTLIERIKNKGEFWQVILAIYSAGRYTDYLSNKDKYPQKKFEKYKLAAESVIDDFKGKVWSWLQETLLH